MTTKARQKNTHVFTIDIFSEVDEVRYQGTFTCKKLTIADLGAVGVRKAQLNGGMYYDPQRPGHGVDWQTDDWNAMIAECEVAITVAPKWWSLNSISDSEVLQKVFQEVNDFQNSFLNRRREASEANGRVDGDEEDSSGDTEESYNRGSVRAVVDKEVLTALEP